LAHNFFYDQENQQMAPWPHQHATVASNVAKKHHDKFYMSTVTVHEFHHRIWAQGWASKEPISDSGNL
jgi:hypothetical protein